MRSWAIVSWMAILWTKGSHGYYSTPPSVSVDKCRVLRNNNPHPPPSECYHGQCEGTFPKGFSWGVATAAYQTEGAWDVDGKGQSIWDEYVHRVPSPIVDNSTGDVADASYYLYERDVQMLRELRVTHYRFSISWTRVLPTGDPNNVNSLGIDYYNRLINELIASNIVPVVTLYHWDTPQALQQRFGGLLSERIVEYYAAYARLCFRSFGDRVKYWITFNEPNLNSYFAYGLGTLAPGLTIESTGPYLVSKHILQSHAVAWELYNREFRQTQQGQIGITVVMEWFEPRSNTAEDRAAADRAKEFFDNWFLHPICNPSGGFPPVMRSYVDRRSEQQGLPHSRLPILSAEWRRRIQGSIDFFGLNHYSTYGVTTPTANLTSEIQRDGDFQVFCLTGQPASITGSAIYPPGFRQILNWVAQRCPNNPILITENGIADRGGLNDQQRITYYRGYLRALLEAIDLDGVNVIGYTAWSLMDNFEWSNGYTQKFGLYQVDFNDSSRPRTPKASASFFRNIVVNNGFTAKRELLRLRGRGPRMR